MIVGLCINGSGSRIPVLFFWYSILVLSVFGATLGELVRRMRVVFKIDPRKGKSVLDAHLVDNLPACFWSCCAAFHRHPDCPVPARSAESPWQCGRHDCGQGLTGHDSLAREHVEVVPRVPLFCWYTVRALVMGVLQRTSGANSRSFDGLRFLGDRWFDAIRMAARS